MATDPRLDWLDSAIKRYGNGPGAKAAARRYRELFAAQAGLVDDLQGPPLLPQGATLRGAEPELGNARHLAERLGSDWTWTYDVRFGGLVWRVEHARGLWVALDGHLFDRLDVVEFVRPMADKLLDAVEEHVKGQVAVTLQQQLDTETGVVTQAVRLEPVSDGWPFDPAPGIEAFVQARGPWTRLPR